MLSLIERDAEQRASQKKRRDAIAQFKYRTALLWTTSGVMIYVIFVLAVVGVFGK